VFEIVSAIEIDAPPSRVWNVLTDFAQFPDWNPFVRYIEGEPRKGERLRVTIEPPGGRQMTFTPTVIAAETTKELRWLGRLGFRGVFDGEHYFKIEPRGVNGSRFVHGERFSGLLVPFLRKSLDTSTRAGFDSMNRALKKRVEARGTATGRFAGKPPRDQTSEVRDA
jgi:hypothetical protein